MTDEDTGHDAPFAAPAIKPLAPTASTEAFSATLAALATPPKVGDVIAHNGNDVKIIGTSIRGQGDFSVIIEGGETLHSR